MFPSLCIEYLHTNKATMKRITKESLSMVFQVTVIIFLFSYSPGSAKEGAMGDSIPPVAKDSSYAAQLNENVTGVNTITGYYAIKPIPGLLYTRLTMASNVKNTGAAIGVKEKIGTKENWPGYSIQPMFLSVK